MPRRDNTTLDLFDWAPPQVAVKFQNEDMVRGATVAARICRSIRLILAECGMERSDVAKAMSEYLGTDVPKSALDAYTSEAKSEHKISLERAAALLHATEDPRLFADILHQHGYAVIPERYLAAVEEAMITDEIETLTRRKKQARASWK